ncbi:hypothetical protein OIU85_001064 [Salix viminalis]|uniref:Binding protein n=1 Tax=Salix viminalis TaxID=40686 RepID=A0A9Q0VKU9_SALVM|nr:hypothetical protein OIU85_001064 [Salix viminalis]
MGCKLGSQWAMRESEQIDPHFKWAHQYKPKPCGPIKKSEFNHRGHISQFLLLSRTGLLSPSVLLEKRKGKSAVFLSRKSCGRVLFTQTSKMLGNYVKKPGVELTARCRLQFCREMHSRNKKAMEFIAKGWNALKEVDRVIDYCERNDKRLIPLLRTAKENFELALAADNSNTHARYWLSKLHLKVPCSRAKSCYRSCFISCRLRVENDYVQSDQQAFYYIEKAVEKLHPGALYLLGAVYLTGDCVRKDVASALWCFHRSSEKGHVGAAIAYGSLLLRGAQVPERLTKFSLKNGSSAKKMNSAENTEMNPVERAKVQFQIAAKGRDLILD